MSVFTYGEAAGYRTSFLLYSTLFDKLLLLKPWASGNLNFSIPNSSSLITVVNSRPIVDPNTYGGPHAHGVDPIPMVGPGMVDPISIQAPCSWWKQSHDAISFQYQTFCYYHIHVIVPFPLPLP